MSGGGGIFGGGGGGGGGGKSREQIEAEQREAAKVERIEFLENRPILSLFDLIPGLAEFQDLRESKRDEQNPFSVLNQIFLDFNKRSREIQRGAALPGAQATNSGGGGGGGGGGFPGSSFIPGGGK